MNADLRPACVGCKDTINSGAVVEFGEYMFHLQCFSCEKCKSHVDCESNPLLLSNGMPICEKCSPNCQACQEKISNEHTMIQLGQDVLGNNAYHEDCFKCVLCKKKIENLVYTQTSKGIYCTPCHGRRKAEKQRRREEREWKKSSRRTPPSPPPDSIYHHDIHKRPHTAEEDAKYWPPLISQSLFEDSTELANLTKTLGASLQHSTKRRQSVKKSISYAAEILRASFAPDFTSSTRNDPGVNNNSSSSLHRWGEEMMGKSRTQAELKRTRQQLETMSTNYNRIKEASRKALDEFSRAKEEFSKEITMRQQLEYTILQLRRRLLPDMGQEDFEQVRHLAEMRVNLESTCRDLRRHRDTLVDDMKKMSGRRDWRYYPSQDEAFKVEVRSLQLERDMLRREVTKLHEERAEVLNEMVFINTKNAQLTEMTNDLSRRLAEREREAAAFMAGTAFLGHDSTENLNPVPICVAARNSVNGPQTPVLHQFNPPFPPTPEPTPPTFKGLPAKPQTRVFNVPLVDLLRAEHRTVPLVVETCINAVKTRALEYEGVYRKGGAATKIKMLKEAFEQGRGQQAVSSDELSNEDDICVITSVLKIYLRELPVPLLTFELYDSWLSAISEEVTWDKKAREFSAILARLPRAYYETLRMLCQHLYRVQEHEETNKMSARNLAIPFGPTLLRPVEEAREMKDQEKRNQVVQYLISHAFELFPVES